jgi:hypothetical protein
MILEWLLSIVLLPVNLVVTLFNMIFGLFGG